MTSATILPSPSPSHCYANGLRYMNNKPGHKRDCWPLRLRLWFRADPVGPVEFVLWRRQLSLQLCKCRKEGSRRRTRGKWSNIWYLYICFREQRKLFSPVPAGPSPIQTCSCCWHINLGVKSPMEVLSLVVVSAFPEALKGSSRIQHVHKVVAKGSKGWAARIEMNNRKMWNFMTSPA